MFETIIRVILRVSLQRLQWALKLYVKSPKLDTLDCACLQGVAFLECSSSFADCFFVIHGAGVDGGAFD